MNTTNKTKQQHETTFADFVRTNKVRNRTQIIPVITGVKIKVHYVGHRINQISIIGSNDREHVIANPNDDAKLTQMANQYKLPLSLADDNGSSAFMPSILRLRVFLYTSENIC